MKKTFLALAIMGMSTLALATGPVVSIGISGSATSGVSGATSSFSNANNVNQATVHSSFAKSQNTTIVGGSVVVGPTGATVSTQAVSTGSTETGGIGYSLTNPGGFGGLGGTSSSAVQYGFGNVTASAEKTAGQIKYDAKANSNVAVGTFSTAATNNSGAALSGSTAGGKNETVVNVSATGNATTHANGITKGEDYVTTYAPPVIGSDETVSAGGVLNLPGVGTVASVQGAATLV